MRTVLKADFFFDRDLLPVHLYYTNSSRELGFHSHEFSEIAILMNGEAIYETDFSVEKVTAGDVLVIPTGGRHNYREEREVELMNILFQFDKLPIPNLSIRRQEGYGAIFRVTPDYYRKKKYYPKIHIPPEAVNRLRDILYPAWLAQLEGAFGSRLTVFGAFLQTIPILLRYYTPDAPHNIRHNLPEKFQACLDYMVLNYRKELTVEELAHRAGMTAATFTRHFKNALGQPPLRFLLQLRLEAAQELLKSGQYSIVEAALESGFSDSNYFSRLFRKYMRVSPRNWQKEQRHS